MAISRGRVVVRWPVTPFVVPRAEGSQPLKGSSLAGFREGTREALEACYREHFGTVHAAVGTVLRGADRETVVHEVFARLISDAKLRGMFKGGRLAPWLRVLSRNQAVDFARHRNYERPHGLVPPTHACSPVDRSAEARLLVERFEKECLPSRWRDVFEARFVLQMDQTTAAARVGVSRTTLAYREHRIRDLLRRFVLRSKV